MIRWQIQMVWVGRLLTSNIHLSTLLRAIKEFNSKMKVISTSTCTRANLGTYIFPIARVCFFFSYLLNAFPFLQILNSAWDKALPVAGQNAFPCYDREGLMKLVETAKPRNDPDHHLFTFLAFQQPLPLVQSAICISELDYFIKSMHGIVFWLSILLPYLFGLPNILHLIQVSSEEYELRRFDFQK